MSTWSGWFTSGVLAARRTDCGAGGGGATALSLMGTSETGVGTGADGGTSSSVARVTTGGVRALVGVRTLVGRGRSGLVVGLAAAMGAAEGEAELPRCIKNSPVPRPMRNTAAPAMISGVLPRDSLDEDTRLALDAEKLARTSLDVDGFRAGADVSSHVDECGVGATATTGAFAGVKGLKAGTVSRVDSSAFLEAEMRGVDSGTLVWATGVGDALTAPAMSSSDGARHAGTTSSGAVGATRAGAVCEAGGSLGTFCG